MHAAPNGQWEGNEWYLDLSNYDLEVVVILHGAAWDRVGVVAWKGRIETTIDAGDVEYPTVLTLQRRYRLATGLGEDLIQHDAALGDAVDVVI